MPGRLKICSTITGAAHHQQELRADRRDHRDHRVLERVPDQDHPLPQPFAQEVLM